LAVEGVPEALDEAVALGRVWHREPAASHHFVE
jgi:hypothetical protein